MKNKKRLFGLISCIIFISLLTLYYMPRYAHADNTVIVIEGESAQATNFSPGIQSNANYSGGKYLKLATSVTAPEEGYFAAYEFQAPEAGYYSLDVATTQTNTAFASRYEIKINDGDFQPATNAVEYDNVDNTLRKFHLDMYELKSGTNTVTFRVKLSRTYPDTQYIMYIDSFSFTPGQAQLKEIEGEAPQFTNFLPGVQANSNYSGGKYLKLSTNDTVPEEGYLAAYEFTIPEEGAYRLDVTTTPPNITWTSPYEVKINDGDFRYVSGEVEYEDIDSTVRRYHLDTYELNSGTNTITFRVKQRRTYPDNQYILYIDSFGFIPADLQFKDILFDAPVNVFQSGEEKKLSFTLNKAAEEAAAISYTVQDYWNNIVDEQTVSIPPGQKAADIELGDLPRGHYRITAQLTGTDQSISEYFAVVISDTERPVLEDSPLALDTAASQLIPSYKKVEFADALKLSGVKWIRDRFRWNDVVNPAPGIFNYEEDRSNDFVPLVSERGINILQVYSSSPSWTRDSSALLPDDLFAAYQFALDSANHFGDQVDAWEIWNEPDISFTTRNETADQYAAFLKAMAIGYSDAAGSPLISMAGLANLPGRYTELMVQNDIAPYIDIYNFHRHQYYKGGNETPSYTEGVEIHQQFKDQYVGKDIPMWVTEAGLGIPLQSPEELPYEEQIIQARYLVTSSITSLSQGTDRHFMFVASPYQEANLYWGMFSRSCTPYASYAAAAALTEAIGLGEYIGVPQGLPGTVAGHIFRDGSDSVMVLWSPVTVEVTLHLEAPEVILTDIMGRKQDLTLAGGNEYQVQTGPDPIYLKYRNDQAPAQSASNPSQQTSAQLLNEAGRIVLVQKYPMEATLGSKTFGHNLKEEQTTISLEIYNFNSNAMEGIMEGITEGGWILDTNSRNIAIGPFEKVVIQFTLSPGPEVKPDVASPITFLGVFGDDTTTKSVAMVYKKYDQAISISELLPGADNPESWRLDLPDAISAVGTGTITAGSEAGAVQFDYHFNSNKEEWVYPFLFLPDHTDYSQYTGLAFTVYAQEDIPDTTMRIFINETTGDRFYTADGFAVKQGWNQITIPFDSLSVFSGRHMYDFVNSAQIKSVQIGLNTKLNEVPSIQIKGICVYQ